MKTKNKCNRFMRGSVNLRTDSIKKIKCKVFCGIFVLLLAIYFSIMWINWDATVIFHQPSLADLEEGYTKEVDDITLHNSRFIEKISYTKEIFQETCERSSYSLLTNLNIRILGYKLEESLCYRCDNKNIYINLRIQPDSTGTRLICNETYGEDWIIKNDRYHPLSYSYIDEITMQRVLKQSKNYEETCIFYQAFDLLKGTWKPKSI